MVPLEDNVTFVCIQLKHVVSELIKHKLQYIMLFNLTTCLSQRQVNVTLSCNWVILYIDCKVYLNYTNFYLCVRVCVCLLSVSMSTCICAHTFVYSLPQRLPIYTVTINYTGAIYTWKCYLLTDDILRNLTIRFIVLTMRKFKK